MIIFNKIVDHKPEINNINIFPHIYLTNKNSCL